jgi:uncharacterized membrane protein
MSSSVYGTESQVKLSADDVRAVSGLLFSIVASFFLAFSGWRKRSLAASGAFAAFFVGVLMLSTGFLFGMTLLLFFYSSSMVTKVQAKRKLLLEDNHQIGGRRDWEQVIANSLFACILCVFYRIAIPAELYTHLMHQPSIVPWVSSNAASSVEFQLSRLHTIIFAAFLAFFSCTNGDTWASELGILSRSLPRLVTAPWKTVPAGTNGGISLLGLGASLAGGLFIGIPYVFMYPHSWYVIVFTGACGLVGSLLDSLLGATLQYSGWDAVKSKVVNQPSPFARRITCGLDMLSNHHVNLVSATMTSCLAAACVPFILPLLS